MTTYTGTSGEDTIHGSKFDDIMFGGADDDFLLGRAGNDYIDGGSGNDVLHGDAGNDTLVGGQGDDFIHGGTGTDTAVYSGSVLDYSFGSDGENFFVYHTGGTQADGDDRLLHVERLQFNDILIDLTQNNGPLAFDDVASTDEDVGTYSSGSASVLDNDFDWEGDSLTATPGTFNGTYGTLVLNADGTYTYTPYGSTQSLALGETVQDSFSYTVSDGSLTDTGTLTINIAGRNDAPVANDDTASTTEDASVSGNVLANDTDVDASDTLTVTTPGTYVGAYGTLVLAADGSYTYTPNAANQALDDGEMVQDSFTYTASDGTASDSATLTVTVNGLNDAPVANDDTASTTEDASVSGNVLTNDTDIDGETLTVATPGTYVGAYGTLVLAADGSYTYTPNAAAQGLDDGEVVSDAFTYTASDGTASDTATLTVNVNGLNDAPVANDDAASTTEDAAVSGNVLANDTDVDGETLTVATPGTYVGAYGTLVLAADGSYTYTPNAAAQGLDDGEVVSDAFTYTASDGTASDTATLTVNVNGLNDAPVANDDTASTTEDAAVSGNVLANDTDVDGETLTVTTPGTYVGAYGTLVLAADGSYTYTPNAANQALDDGEMVQDSFTYTASDGTASDSATLTVTVNGLNDAPVANDDTASTTEDASVSGNVLTNDTDIDGETLTVATPGTYVGAYGTLVLAADGSYTYTPNAAAQALDDGEMVQDAFTYTASDGTASDTATLTVTVNGLNDAPVANDDTASTTEDAAVSGNVLANDTDVDGETLTVATPGTYVGAYGTLVLAADGSYSYTPNAAAQALDDGEVVSDAFTYTASDGTASDTATLTVNVNGLNDAPVANDDAASTTEDAAVSGNVLANDTDVDGETLTVANPGVYVGAYGTLNLNANGNYTYAPNAAAQGLDSGETVQDSFTYTASDGTASDLATLTVTVNGANDAPVANDDTASTSEDGSASGDVLANDTDVDGETLTVTNPGTYTGTYGTLTLNADGSYTYAPNAAQQGLDTGETVNDVFTYTASDGTASDSATLTVTVTGANDAPVANHDTASTDEDTSVSGNVLANDTDVDGETLTVTNPGTYAGTYGTLTLAADGSYTYAPNAAAQALDAGDVVNDVFSYTASDGTDSDAATLTVTVTGADEGPQTVWYIDNSAVGSTNVGTQANPFTSIASFNAAQGNVGGPQDGATVYLLQGTGTYAEADGINLLDDQILIGVGQPTIAPTSGNGIDLADNNNVSGVDINVSAGNVGIEDDGSSVGNLTVSDVAIAGAGQIVDLDTGGTLNVTLNSASSLGSAGGAIDLAGVGGSFTITGATTISGVHSGGGIDITGSSITATFGGGGTVATLATTAVNFVGNTGALAIGGGFDIVTTTGAGLNATGGGTVTVTGSGNSIVSVGGTALNVAGTNIGAGGLNFDSISANGGTNGIVLTNTGSAGGLNVVGDGGGTNNGSGGTIQNMTGDGILLTNTENVRLAYMNVQDNDGDGIGGSGVNGFVLNRLNISDNGTSALLDHAGINIAGLTGTSSAGARPTSISNSVISNNFEFEVVISNSAGTLTNLRVIDSTMSSNGATGQHGDLFSFRSSGTASMGLTVSGSTFDGNTVAGQLTGTAVNVNAGGGTVNADVGTSNFIDNSLAVIMSASANANLTFDVHDNGMTGNRSHGINVFSSSGATGTINGTIENNVVGTQGVAGSGSLVGRGIQVSMEGGGTTNLLITGNTVQSIASLEGISVIESLTVGIVNATITNNIIRDIPTARGLLVQTLNAGTLNASISGNQFSNIGAAQDLRIAESLAGTLNITQLQATAVANPNQLDDANGIPSTRVSVAGTPQYGQPAPTLPSGPSLPLMAAREGPGAAGDDLSQSALDLIVNAAIDRWAAAGASDDQLATMRAVAFDIANMTGLTLGSSSDGHVIIDSDAAGFGWFVDATPGDDSEYSGSGTLLIAAADTEAGERMDLLTTVMHELGHQMGLGDDHDHDHRGELMFATIDTGERRLPEGMFEAEIALIPAGRAGWGDLPLTYPDYPMV